LKKQKEYVRSELSGEVEVKDAYQDVLREIQIMKELDHICLIRIHEVINEKDGDKLYMGKIPRAHVVVMDYAKYGQIMDWNMDTLKFTPCLKSKPQFTERDIQKILRDCIRGLDYRKLLSLYPFSSPLTQHLAQGY